MSDSITKYGTIVTQLGKERIAACILSGTLVDITQAAVGDGGGAYYQPDGSQTALKNECWRGKIASAQINLQNKNMIDVKLVIGAEVGGFFIREAALYTSDGLMLAICNLPDTEKVAFSDGVSGKLSLLLHLIVEDASVLHFILNPTLDTVSREEMQDALREQKEQLEDLIQGVGGIQILEITLPAEGWTEAEPGGEDYPWVLDLPLAGVTETQDPSVSIHKESLEISRAAGLCPTVQTLEGSLRFWAMEKPLETMEATAALISPRGGFSGGDAGGLPIATANTLGGVMIGENVDVSADGKISVKEIPVPAENSEIRDMVAKAFLSD